MLAGGDDYAGVAGYTDGLRGIRLFEKEAGHDGALKSNWDRGRWVTLSSRLREPRWYPTQVRGAAVPSRGSRPPHGVLSTC